VIAVATRSVHFSPLWWGSWGVGVMGVGGRGFIALVFSPKALGFHWLSVRPVLFARVQDCDFYSTSVLGLCFFAARFPAMFGSSV
jgi:hypothetical protein